jgi:hypothetical protein
MIRLGSFIGIARVSDYDGRFAANEDVSLLMERVAFYNVPSRRPSEMTAIVFERADGHSTHFQIIKEEA